MFVSANSLEQFDPNVQNGLIANPYNDEEIIFISFYRGKKNAYYLDLEKRKSYKYKVNEDLPLTGISVFINSNKKLLGYYAQGEVYVYDYNDFRLKSKIIIDTDPRVTGIYTEFSKDGTQLYKFDKKNYTITIYDISSGNKQDEFNLGYQGKNIELFSFNKYKDEIAFKVDDMMEILSIPAKQISVKFSFTSSPNEIQFRQNGDVFFYYENNSVYILNSQTGAEIFAKQLHLDLKWIDFSPNMKYLICNFMNQSQQIYDIEKNEIITFQDTEFINSENFVAYYVSSNFSSILGYEFQTYWCGANGDLPGYLDVMYQYSTNPFQKTNSISDGYISYPKLGVFSSNNEFVLVNGQNDVNSSGDDYNVNVLLDKNGEFVKYIHINNVPKSFTSDSQYIVFSDSGKIRFYDFLNNTFEKEYDSGRNIDWNVDFTFHNSELMVLHSPEFIEVINFEDYTPKFEIDLKSNGIINPIIRVSKDGKITICDGKKLWTVNIDTGLLTPPTSIKLSGTIQDLSDNGKYILSQSNDRTFYKYNVETNEVDYAYAHPDIKENFGTTVKSGFWGNADYIWITYRTNSMYENGCIMHLHDIINRTSKTFNRYEGYPNISASKTAPILFHGSCPFTYDIKSSEILSSIIENQIIATSSNIYPNPAGDYIEISIPDNSNSTLQGGVTKGQEKVQIFNTLGIEVLSESIHPMTSSHRMNIEMLPVGIYFIKIGDRVEKFVKI
jgi:hypothetical protein